MKGILKIIVVFFIGVFTAMFFSRKKRELAVYTRIQKRRDESALFAVRLRQNTEKELQKITKEVRDESVENIANRFFDVFGRKPKGS